MRFDSPSYFLPQAPLFKLTTVSALSLQSNKNSVNQVIHNEDELKEGDKQNEDLLTVVSTKKDKLFSSLVCICGSHLIQNKQRVYVSFCICDRCNAQLFGDDVIYHCPRDKTPEHEYGWDLCQQCATNLQVISSPKIEEGIILFYDKYSGL